MKEVELLREPQLEFGNGFLCDDPKMGISCGGFYSITNSTHRSEIPYAVIGTKLHIQLFNEWLNELSNRIEAKSKEVTLIQAPEIIDGEIQDLFSEDDTFQALEKEETGFIINKKLNPDFPGFRRESAFRCEFTNDPDNNISIKESEIAEITKEKGKKYLKIDELANVFVQAYQNLIDTCVTRPDICFVIIPSEVYKRFASAQLYKQSINFRRLLKANIMSLAKADIPIQIVLESTIKGTKRNLQDLSMIAWNFVTAQYYKTQNCIPWILNEVDKNTCFIGISFHKVLNSENNKLRSSIAQAFNREGKGLVFMGKQFEWDKEEIQVASPHLQYEYSVNLLKDVITEYKKIIKHTPSRIVVHKTTDYWDQLINPRFAEVEGITDGITEIMGKDVEVDLVTLKTSKIKLLRSRGKYPVLRGTLLNLTEKEGILYSTGYIPYYETYPGLYIPHPIHVKIFQGESSLRQISSEILALTKLNFNNCNYYDGLPITIRFAQKVGEILQYFPEGFVPPNKYYFYM